MTSNTIPQPERLKVRQNDDGLMEIQIKLRKYKFWVKEANVLTRFTLSSFVSELLQELSESDDYNDQVRRNMLTEVWAPLYACSEGEVPTKEQFLMLSPTDMNFWVRTAKELGHSFEWLDGVETIYNGVSEDTSASKKKARLPEDNPEVEEVAS